MYLDVLQDIARLVISALNLGGYFGRTPLDSFRKFA
jgi:hypothetical protein